MQKGRFPQLDTLDNTDVIWQTSGIREMDLCFCIGNVPIPVEYHSNHQA
jgi:hypothetical protein